MGIREEDVEIFVEKINKIIPLLNGEDPEILKEQDYGIPKPAKSKFFGPKVGVVIKNRHLLLLYVGKKIQFLKANGKEIEGLTYFSPSSLQRNANYDAFKPDKIHYERTHVVKHYLRYRDEGLVVCRKVGGTNLFALTEKGEQYCKKIIDELILCLPEAKRPTMVCKAEIQGTIKPRNAFLHLEEYCKRSDIRPVLKYNRFFGRKQELDELNNFLRSSAKKIMIIFGDSGVGKTRLILQFATQLEGHKEKETRWNVYFIHPYETFQMQPHGRTLLILDDAVRYQDLDKLIDFVVNSSDIEVRLLITSLSIFRNLIMNRVKEKNYDPDIIMLNRGDIVSFLQYNFPRIDKAIASQIEGQCRNSFVYAIVCAEYWTEEGVSDELKKILSWKRERYIRNMSEKTRCNIEDVTYVIDLISLVMPLDWVADKEYLKNII